MFRLPEVSDRTEGAELAGEDAVQGAALAGLLAAQEAAANAMRAGDAEADAARDRQARSRGHALLDGLARLQRRLLEGAVDADSLQALAALCDETAGEAANAGLRDILAEIRLRVRIEIARFATAK